MQTKPYFVKNTSTIKTFFKAILSSDECQEATSYLLPMVLLKKYKNVTGYGLNPPFKDNPMAGGGMLLPFCCSIPVFPTPSRRKVFQCSDFPQC